jgi:flagellar basal-body rod modification protein FlgD
MAGITAASALSNSKSTDTSGSTTDAINDLDLGTFLTLMIKELQNQDPLNPLDNKDMLAQLSQIRSVGATDKLTKTLDSVLLGQNISSAANLIGADISALSDDGQPVTGIVNRVSIDQGVPKVHVDNTAGLAPSGASGEIEAGTYGYRVVWQDDSGKLFGLDFSGDQAITTTGAAGVDQAIQLRNLPKSDGPKKVFRTDATGKAPYQLVDTIVDGSQGTFTDTLSDGQRNGTQLTQEFQRATNASRSYEVSLSNISVIRPPG